MLIMDSHDIASSARRPLLILLYNSCFGTYPDFDGFNCKTPCRFVTDRSCLRTADAVVFHLLGRDEIGDAIKYPGQLWVAWSMESRANTPGADDPALMRNFDLHMNFSRAADVWCPYIPKIDVWKAALSEPVAAKRSDRLCVMFQSALNNRSGRNAYAAELMRHMPVDSYGTFLNNHKIAGPDRGSATKMDIIRSYKFCLGFENTLEMDYVTEKFFQPLLAGAIPVYRGAPNIAQYAPGENCYIDAGQFHSPKLLAEYLLHLANDQNACDQFLRWRTKPLRAGFLSLLEEFSEEAFCRLASAVSAMRGAAPQTFPSGRKMRPFGWNGFVRTKKWRLKQSVKRLLRYKADRSAE